MHKVILEDKFFFYPSCIAAGVRFVIWKGWKKDPLEMNQSRNEMDVTSVIASEFNHSLNICIPSQDGSGRSISKVDGIERICQS